MNRTASLLMGVLVSFCAASWAAADTTVTIEKTHLCCGSCVKGVATAVKTVPGVSAKCDQKTGTVTLKAADEATAQKAVDAIAEAGYFGKVTGATIKADAAPAGSVKSLTISGIHNCCGKCTKAINAAIKTVPGATCEVPAKAETFTVTGDFDAGKLVAALSDAGFSVKASAK